MNCLNCDKPLIIEIKTKPAKYCSDACRKAFKRKNADNAIISPKAGIKNAPRLNMARDNGQTHTKLPEKTDKIESGQIDNGQAADMTGNNMTPAVRPVIPIPPCPRGINPNIWTMQHERKAGYQYKDRKSMQVAI